MATCTSLWEFATAVAGSIIGINPFDQPDVEDARSPRASAPILTTTRGRSPRVANSQREVQVAIETSILLLRSFSRPDRAAVWGLIKMGSGQSR